MSNSQKSQPPKTTPFHWGTIGWLFGCCLFITAIGHFIHPAFLLLLAPTTLLLLLALLKPKPPKKIPDTKKEDIKPIQENFWSKRTFNEE